MAKQTIGLGSSANDGTGDSLRVGGDKINDNTNEIYTAIGDGTDLKISVAGASSNQVLQWSTSNNRFEPTASAAAGDISVDTTPQLGGDLDVQNHKIVSTSNQNIEILPHGTGRIKLDALTFPNDAGTANYVLATDGSSAMFWKQVGSNITLSNGSTTDNYVIGNTLLFSAGSGLTSSILDDTVKYDIDNSIVVTLSDNQTLSNKEYDNPTFTGSSSGTGILRQSTLGSFIAQGATSLAAFQSAASFGGAFGVDTTTHKAYYASNSTWNEILSSTSSIDVLADVDTTTQAPTSGQALVWNVGSSNWRPSTITTSVVSDTAPSLGGNLDTAGNTIQGTGKLALTGSGSMARFDFTNTASLPVAASNAGGFAVTTSTNRAYFATASGWISLLSENDGIDKFSDVDTTTSAPAFGQVLVWTNVSGVGRWIPADYTPAVRVSAQFNVSNSGSTDYVFSGDGFPTNQNDPVLYLKKAHTYQFVVNASGHPFQILTASGGSLYSFGVTNNATAVGTITFTVPMNAPSTLYYQCSAHAGMGNTINIA